jgi:hypothetical protein
MPYLNIHPSFIPFSLTALKGASFLTRPAFASSLSGQ